MRRMGNICWLPRFWINSLEDTGKKIIYKQFFTHHSFKMAEFNFVQNNMIQIAKYEYIFNLFCTFVT